MNSLDWINKQIKICKKQIKKLKELVISCDRKSPDSDIQVLSYFYRNEASDRIQEYKRLLIILNQIKTQLEAWEVVKNKIYYDPSKEYIDLSLIYLNCVKDKNYQKLKKALEINYETNRCNK